jgi:CDP-paratose 2-epimerase
MALAVVTGSGGLVGSEAVRRLVREGYDVVGIENDMRARFFGPEASTAHVTEALRREFPDFRSLEIDIRDEDAVNALFAEHGDTVELVVHAAAQPSHDWAAREPKTDFAINAWGTLNLLEAVRANCPAATFVFVSTNKLYGDRPNRLPLEELDTRLELPADHRYREGIDTSMSTDRSTHSLFGVSKTSADFMVQEYGRYFGIPTVCFRCGCITGPAHAGTILHGFLAYLMKCTVTGTPYTIFGFGGKQVRDNLHSADLVDAFLAFHAAPREAAVYNLGGGRRANVSLLEAIEACERIADRELPREITDEARIGDHRWWISDLAEFRADYPDWDVRHGIEDTLREIHDANVERWAAARV